MSISTEEAKARYPEAETFKFGDNRELCDKLLSLIRIGKKRATCGALKEFRENNEPMPVVGRRDIALDWDGVPALVIETTEITIRRFCDVDAHFALAEGENETLEGWQVGHQAFFERNGGWRPDMELVCERFTLVEDFS
ncbi:MAG: ASCH domain-containing protein [Verrucomicrobiota bacterium]